MGDPTDTKAPQRGRPRSEASRRAVLSAAMELLQSDGLRQMTVDALAKRAGVSKATIYKWWPNKALVALDALLEDTESAVPIPDTGSAAEDLRRQLRSSVRFYTGPKGAVYRQFVAEAQLDREFARQFVERFLARRRHAVQAIWERGVRCGVFRADVDPHVALDLIYGSMIFRLLMADPPLSPETVDPLLDAALNGLSAARIGGTP